MRMTDRDTDSDLARRVRAGDSEAFGLLIERYKGRAYAQALAIVRSREDALDLSQEAFARAFRARHTLDPERPFYAWLCQILRRLCFNFLRDTRTQGQVIDASGADWLVSTAAAVQEDPQREAERSEERRRVAAAIDALPPHEREVLVLKEFEDLKYREIAELLGIPVGTVMSRLFSARRRLAGALEAHR